MASRRIEELRILAGRFADGAGSPSDVQSLFLGLRSLNFNNANFREVGDFVAHSDERIQGVVTDRARDFMRVWRLMMSNLGGLTLNLSQAELAATLRSALRVRSDTGLVTSLGYSRDIAKSVLGSTLRKIGELENGSVNVLRQLTPREKLLLGALLHQLEFTTAFTEADLLAEFKSVLSKNGVISDPDRLNHLGPKLAAFAISYMHRAHILSPDGDELALGASVTPDGVVFVTARVIKVASPIPTVPAGAFRVFVFQTQTAAALICGADMMGSDGDPEKDFYWIAPVELGPDFRLRWL